MCMTVSGASLGCPLMDAAFSDQAHLRPQKNTDVPQSTAAGLQSVMPQLELLAQALLCSCSVWVTWAVVSEGTLSEYGCFVVDEEAPTFSKLPYESS